MKVTIKPKPGSVGGALERKLEKLLVFGAISTRCDDAMAQAIRENDPHAILEYYRAVNVWIDFALTRVLEMCAETLKNTKSWHDLAGKPDDFNKALDKVTRGAGIALKLLYRIPDHRPSENEKRDQELYRLKNEHLNDWSFGQLANQYNRLHPTDQISANIAERSVKAHLERISRKIQHALNAADVYREASSLSMKELYPELPTPQFILDILTTK
jgi:hypothetical protein